MCDEIIHISPNFNGASVEFWERISNSIPKFTGLVIIYSCWNLKFIYVSKMAPDIKIEKVFGEHGFHLVRGYK